MIYNYKLQNTLLSHSFTASTKALFWTHWRAYKHTPRPPAAFNTALTAFYYFLNPLQQPLLLISTLSPAIAALIEQF